MSKEGIFASQRINRLRRINLAEARRNHLIFKIFRMSGIKALLKMTKN